METLQLAQMLADISDLDARHEEAHAAVALVNANKPAVTASAPATPELGAGGLKPPTATADARHHQRVGSASTTVGRTASPPSRPFDMLGRRILTPPMTRSSSNQGSIPGTPRRDSDNEDDVDRASTLMAFYEIRNKLKQQDNSSLIKAREKIAALAAKQKAQVAAEQREAQAQAHARYVYPKQT